MDDSLPSKRMRDKGQVQAQTGAQSFASVFGLNDMFPGKGVQRGLCFLLFSGCVKRQPNQQQHVYNHAV